MQSVLSLFRLGLDGLLLNPTAYRSQRDAPDGLRRGFILVALVGILVGFASLIGNIGEYLSEPSPELVSQTVYDKLRAMPLFTDLSSNNPNFSAQFDQIFNLATQINQLASGGGLIRNLAGLIIIPLTLLAIWLVFGIVAHLMARSLGGKGTFSQTLACTALASGINMLGVVQLIPFAQGAGTMLLGLIASYIAIREAHTLPPWRAFWATVFGPAIVVLLVLILSCAMIALAFGSISAAMQGGIS